MPTEAIAGDITCCPGRGKHVEARDRERAKGTAACSRWDSAFERQYLVQCPSWPADVWPWGCLGVGTVDDGGSAGHVPPSPRGLLCGLRLLYGMRCPSPARGTRLEGSTGQSCCSGPGNPQHRLPCTPPSSCGGPEDCIHHCCLGTGPVPREPDPEPARGSERVCAGLGSEVHSRSQQRVPPEPFPGLRLTSMSPFLLF